MSEQFTDPGTSTGIQWGDVKGSLLLVTVHSLEPGIVTSLGEKDAIRADIVVLDGDQSGEVYDDALVFPRKLIGQLRPRIGEKVLGRLGQGNAKPGQNPPWELTPATDADKKVAAAHLNKVSDVPF